jgi:hypothetical protein
MIFKEKGKIEMDRYTYELKGQLLGHFKKPGGERAPDSLGTNPHGTVDLETGRFFEDTKKHLSETK